MPDKKKEDFTEVTISAFEYDQLIQDSLWLGCLEGAGVDNWDGYSDAQEMFEDYIDENCKVH